LIEYLLITRPEEKWLEDVNNGSMKQRDLMLALEKEHKTLFPEYQKKGHETTKVSDGWSVQGQVLQLWTMGPQE
jgi:hypothetical protein